MAKKKFDPLGEVKTSAQKIWLAGLGALAEAEKQGDKLFKSLVKKGRKLDDTLREPLGDAADAVTGSVKAARNQARKTFEGVESTFDAQVAAAMKRLGVARREEVDTLRDEVDRLKLELRRKTTTRKKKAATRKKKVQRKTGKKKTKGTLKKG